MRSHISEIVGRTEPTLQAVKHSATIGYTVASNGLLIDCVVSRDADGNDYTIHGIPVIGPWVINSGDAALLMYSQHSPRAPYAIMPLWPAGVDPSSWAPTLRLRASPSITEKIYEAIVDSNGNGDYTSLAAAVAAGKSSFRVKKGHSETLSAVLTLPSDAIVDCEDVDNCSFNVGSYYIANTSAATWIRGNIIGGTDAVNGAVKISAAGPFEFWATHFYNNARHIGGDGGVSGGPYFSLIGCELEYAGTGNVCNTPADYAAILYCRITNIVSRSVTLSGVGCRFIGNYCSNVTVTAAGTGSRVIGNVGVADVGAGPDHNLWANPPHGDVSGTPAQFQMIVRGAALWELITAPVDDGRILASGSAALVGVAMPTHMLDGAKHSVSGLTIGHILQGLSATTFGFAVIPAHTSRHENGGADEISVLGLSGLLADGQTPLAHKTNHQDGGADEISVAALSGQLADAQKVAVQDEGVAAGTRPTVNFTGTGVAATDDVVNNRVNVAIPGGGGALYTDSGDHGTGANTAEVTLASYSLPANTLAAGKRLTINVKGRYNSGAEEPPSSYLRVYWGTQKVAEWLVVAVGPGVTTDLWGTVEVMCKGATDNEVVSQGYAQGPDGGPYVMSVQDTQNVTGAITIAVKGLTPDALDEITCEFFQVGPVVA